MIRFDVLGFEFDNVEPAFTEIDAEFYYHFCERKLYEKGSFDAMLTAEGKAFGAGELAVPSADYMKGHGSIVTRVDPSDLSGGASPPPAPIVAPSAPITAAVTKTPTPTADDTGEITIYGGPSDAVYLINVALKDAVSAGEDTNNINVAAGDTAAQVATRLAAAMSDPNASAVAVGDVVTYSPKLGSTLTKLEVTVT